MFFRNLTFFRFPKSFAKTLDDLDARLEDCRLKPVGPSELMSRGFIPPFGRDAEAMSHRVGDAIWITLGGEDRLLPGAVVNDELGKRIAAMEEKEGRKLGGRARKRLKEDLVMELLPRAFVRPVQTNATLDLQHGFSLQPLNMNFHVLPGYDHVITITPTSKGEFTIVCNEFCGIGHHAMTGKIFVE